MFRLVLAGALSLACSLALAQVGPGPQPQPAFSGGTLSQPLITTPSVTAASGLNIAPGVAPTSPNAGDLWATSTGLFARFGGVTTGPITGAAGSTGQIQTNNSGALAGVTLGGDCTFSTPQINCTKTSGVSFAPSATTDTTNASNISTGTLAAVRGGAGTVTGALKGNGSGVVSQAACGDLSNGAASCSTDTTNAANISSGTLPTGRMPAFTGDVTSPGGSLTLTLAWISRVTGKTVTFNNTLTFAGTDSTTMTFPAANASVAALNLTGQNLSGGAVVTPNSLASGNLTIDCGKSPLQWIVNTGAFTITAPAVTTTTNQNCVLRVINGTTAANAGAVTLSGFSGKSPGGATFSTTATVSAASATFTNGSANITWTANGLSLGSVVFFATTGTLPTNFSTATLYYVVTTGTNTIQVAATPGGAAITAGSAGSGTQTGFVPSVFDLVVLAINGPAYSQWVPVQ
jgi:hypothetical protein